MRKGIHPQRQWISYVTQSGRLVNVMMTKIHHAGKVYHFRAKRQMAQSLGQIAKFNRNRKSCLYELKKDVIFRTFRGENLNTPFENSDASEEGASARLKLFAARLLAWFLSRIMGASVVFRVAGWNCLRDVVVKFNKLDEGIYGRHLEVAIWDQTCDLKVMEKDDLSRNMQGLSTQEKRPDCSVQARKSVIRLQQESS
ncbi:hypothetical protein IFM89_014755 [Coptis chinensis]|uniref:Uncharacterized protein n=1 Tax=Coptis chinensis TaxID=261450 RepID=A0A835ISG4_9MAGN|nr:hypothetical protein IFM89_014755 [Coptis chinensis]